MIGSRILNVSSLYNNLNVEAILTDGVFALSRNGDEAKKKKK